MSVRVYVSPEYRSGHAYIDSTHRLSGTLQGKKNTSSAQRVLILPFCQGGTELKAVRFFSGFRSEVSVVREAITVL